MIRVLKTLETEKHRLRQVNANDRSHAGRHPDGRIRRSIPARRLCGSQTSAGYRRQAPYRASSYEIPAEWRFVFIVNEDQLQKTSLAEVLRALRPHAEIAAIQTHKKGPVFTLLQGASVIADDMPTLVNYCDFSFPGTSAISPISFQPGSRWGDPLLPWFPSSLPREHPVRLLPETEGRVLEVRRKGISRRTASRNTLLREPTTSPPGTAQTIWTDRPGEGPLHKRRILRQRCYNPMIDDGKRIFVHEIPFMLQWGTPEDLEDYLYWHRLFETWNSQVQRPQKGPCASSCRWPAWDRVSRISNAPTADPGPGAAHVPHGHELPPTLEEKTGFSGSHGIGGGRAFLRRGGIIALEKPTQGQADSTLAALNAVDPEDPVLVSACDHGFYGTRRPGAAFGTEAGRGSLRTARLSGSAENTRLLFLFRNGP